MGRTRRRCATGEWRGVDDAREDGVDFLPMPETVVAALLKRASAD
jgi:hypothetical protein